MTDPEGNPQVDDARSVADLKKRRGELAYEAQMCALESLPLAPSTKQELEALDAELRRRGVDLSSD